MISILIPLYNDDCGQLAHDLLALARREQVPVEVIIGDDGSTDERTLAMLQALDGSEGVTVLRTKENLGRARNCNRLADAAHGQWLLFVDSDASVPPGFSLSRYAQAAETGQAKVVCGSLRHPETNPNPAATLRWKYEKRADLQRTAAIRSKDPYARLSTFNLLVEAATFQSIRFSEQCQQYGYEDTLFGVALRQRGVPLLHIDNPLIHTGLEDNAVFLAKTETALRTLKALEGQMDGGSRLENTANRLRKWHLAGVFVAIWKLLRRPLRRNLLGTNPSLRAFNIYKLGYFLHL